MSNIFQSGPNPRRNAWGGVENQGSPPPWKNCIYVPVNKGPGPRTVDRAGPFLKQDRRPRTAVIFWRGPWTEDRGPKKGPFAHLCILYILDTYLTSSKGLLSNGKLICLSSCFRHRGAISVSAWGGQGKSKFFWKHTKEWYFSLISWKLYVFPNFI